VSAEVDSDELVPTEVGDVDVDVLSAAVVSTDDELDVEPSGASSAPDVPAHAVRARTITETMDCARSFVTNRCMSLPSHRWGNTAPGTPTGISHT
jgi:hypothetical protein